ncbi:MAG: molybdopterin-dependent oxidoreductase [Gudongella sp.]|nr:molybdopterin-dependent oxidoreductase [Gudongella sp.]
MKSKKLAIIIIVLLVVVFVFSLFLNKENIGKRKELLENAQIEIIVNGDIYLLNKEIIEEIGTVEFNAILDTSTGSASEHRYQGIELSEILNYFGGIKEDASAIIAHGADGYSVAYSREEVFTEHKIYIAYMEDGEFLGGIDEGGRGPFEIIVLNDQFSNRRCKWLIRIGVV